MPLAPKFTRAEAALIRRLTTPAKVQAWLSTLRYNYEESGQPTLRSFRRVLRDGTAHCLEGTLAAAAILREHGYPPRLVCLEARDLDHNLFVYRKDGRWGSVGQSRDPHLKDRPPRFRTMRDLVLSYYPYYWNLHTHDLTDLTIRGYAVVDLSRFEDDWITAEEDVRFVEDFLYDIPYRALFPYEEHHRYVCGRDAKLVWIA